MIDQSNGQHMRKQVPDEPIPHEEDVLENEQVDDAPEPDLVMQSLMRVRGKNAENKAKWHDKKLLEAKASKKSRIEKNKRVIDLVNKEHV